MINISKKCLCSHPSDSYDMQKISLFICILRWKIRYLVNPAYPPPLLLSLHSIYGHFIWHLMFFEKRSGERKGEKEEGKGKKIKGREGAYTPPPSSSPSLNYTFDSIHKRSRIQCKIESSTVDTDTDNVCDGKLPLNMK